jgi:peptidoglycan hydrolase-like protein with peptidoglycan-binding domain
MYEGPPQDGAETEYRRRRREPPIIRRPDRIALWAVGMAVVAMVAAAASAHAGPGGTGSTDDGSCPNASFGSRALSIGDCGTDVKTLHWIMRADSYRVSLDRQFDDSTEGAVRDFQARSGLEQSGVVHKDTRKQLARTMSKSTATWYGPGFWNQETACGKTLKRRTLGVAHRKLPCGTKVTLKYGGRYVTTRVIDRGPYTTGLRWDLTKRTAKELHLTNTDDIRAAPIRK